MFFLRKSDRPANGVAARLQRMRQAGYTRGAHEARLFTLALGKNAASHQAVDWINTAIDEGRSDLEAQHAIEREVDAWDMSCRIMFMVMTA